MTTIASANALPRARMLVSVVLAASVLSGGALSEQAAAPATTGPAQVDWANTERYRAADLELRAHPKTGPLVVFFGDSLTEHWGMRDAAGVAESGNFLAEHGYANRGISGQTTPQMLVRFRQDVLDLHPDLVVLLAGTNDIAGNTGPMTLEQTEGNLQTMTELARLHGISVILCTLPPALRFWWTPQVTPRASIVTLNGWLKQYAAAEGLPLVDYFHALASPEGGMLPALADDGVHPNKAGYARMQPLVESAIEQALSRRTGAAR